MVQARGCGTGWLGLGGTAAAVRGHRPRADTRPSAHPLTWKFNHADLAPHSHLRGEEDRGRRLAALHPEVSTPSPRPLTLSKPKGCIAP